jgi:transcriptional repressor NrdR
MKCPLCRSTNTEVFNTRSTKYGSQIWRRRRCNQCERSFTTYEAPDLGFVRIHSTNNAKAQPYSRAKLFMSIYHAFADTAAPAATIDAVTDTVEAKLLDTASAELATSQISAVVLQTLKHFSTAAFIRYLSAQTDLVSEAQLRRELKKY